MEHENSVAETLSSYFNLDALQPDYANESDNLTQGALHTVENTVEITDQNCTEEIRNRITDEVIREQIKSHIHDKYVCLLEADPEVVYKMYVSEKLPICLIPENFRNRHPVYYAKYLLEMVSVKNDPTLSQSEKRYHLRGILTPDPDVIINIGWKHLRDFIPEMYNKRKNSRNPPYATLLNHLKFAKADFIQNSADKVDETFVTGVLEMENRVFSTWKEKPNYSFTNLLIK